MRFVNDNNVLKRAFKMRFVFIILMIPVLLMTNGCKKQADSSGSVDKTYIYISNYDGDTITWFELDMTSGILYRKGEKSVMKQPGPLAFYKETGIIYATMRGENSVSAYRIASSSGDLIPIGTTRVAGNPAYLSLDRSGKYLFTAYYRDEQIAVHRIGVDGMVDSSTVQIIETAKNPHAILADPSNRYVYVPHTGGNVIFSFTFNGKNGRLTLMENGMVTPGDMAQPRHLFFHPEKNMVYVSNEKGSSVTTYKVDPKNGYLHSLQTLSTIPDDYSEKNTCADVEVHPSGRYVYISNRGHNSIASFSVDPESGMLSPITHTPTEPVPRSFNMDLSGQIMIVAGQESNTLRVYRIDVDSGELHPLEQYDVGKGPSWVEIVTLIDR